jgi:MFS family permease
VTPQISPRLSCSSSVSLIEISLGTIPVQSYPWPKNSHLIAIVRLAEPIALTSIFPYAWALVKKFEVGDEKNASFYAGLLISSFALAEAMTGMFWGGLSDRIGRKPVLLVGCTGTLLSLLMVGFSANIWVALVGRAIGGFLNGNIGVIQTMVGELVTKKEHERTFASIQTRIAVNIY